MNFIKSNLIGIILLILSNIIVSIQFNIVLGLILFVIELAILQLQYLIKKVLSSQSRILDLHQTTTVKFSELVSSQSKLHEQVLNITNLMTNMKQLKFIRLGDDLLMGWVEFHMDLIPKKRYKETPLGGGVINIDVNNKSITFTGKSQDFGKVDPAWLSDWIKRNKVDLISDLDLLTHCSIEYLEKYHIVINIK